MRQDVKLRLLRCAYHFFVSCLWRCFTLLASWSNTAAKFNLKMKKRVEIHHRIKFLGRKLLIKLTWRCECARKLSSRVSCCFWNRVIMALVQCTRGPEEPLPKEPSDVFHYCITTEREPLSLQRSLSAKKTKSNAHTPVAQHSLSHVHNYRQLHKY
jgi:hypothetical protein